LNGSLVSSSIGSLRNHPVVERWLDGQSRIFLTVCNPNDLRKNLLNLIDGFTMANDTIRPDLLVIKLAVPIGAEFLESSLFDHMLPRYGGPVALYEPNVVFISDFLSDREMRALYSLADYYLCASHCEGFNLPLLEAMAHGTVPISTRNTAMLDYIEEGRAIVISERSYPGLVPGLASDESGVSTLVSVASRRDVAIAVKSASGLSPEKYDAIAAANRDTVARLYSESTVMRIVDKRLNALMAAEKDLHLAR
jgi:glycosyltransferase involved in cell wall biosynthesis